MFIAIIIVALGDDAKAMFFIQFLRGNVAVAHFQEKAVVRLALQHQRDQLAGATALTILGGGGNQVQFGFIKQRLPHDEGGNFIAHFADENVAVGRFQAAFKLGDLPSVGIVGLVNLGERGQIIGCGWACVEHGFMAQFKSRNYNAFI